MRGSRTKARSLSTSRVWKDIRSFFVFKIAAVNTALGSGAYMVDHGFRVVYDKDMDTNEDLSYMIHKATKRAFRFRREKNVWLLDAVVAADSVLGYSRPE